MRHQQLIGIVAISLFIGFMDFGLPGEALSRRKLPSIVNGCSVNQMSSIFCQACVDRIITEGGDTRQFECFCNSRGITCCTVRDGRATSCDGYSSTPATQSRGVPQGSGPQSQGVEGGEEPTGGSIPPWVEEELKKRPQADLEGK